MMPTNDATTIAEALEHGLDDLFEHSGLFSLLHHVYVLCLSLTADLDGANVRYKFWLAGIALDVT